MFTQKSTQTLTRRVRRSPLLELLTGPHGVDRYTELVDPTWTRGDARAKVIAVRRQTPRSVTLTLEPNRAFTGFRAGQHINLTVEINGRRRTRPYSPASAEGSPYIELTVGRHEGGLVSEYLNRACPARDGGRPGFGRRGLRDAGGSARAGCRRRGGSAAHPVRLRRQRYHPGDVDAAHPAGGGLRPRDHLRPLRAHARRGLLPRRACGHGGSAGAARLHPRRRRRAHRSFRCRTPGCCDARARGGLRVRAAGTRGCRPDTRPGRIVGKLRPTGICAVHRDGGRDRQFRRQRCRP